MTEDDLSKDASVFRVGEVSAVQGRTVKVVVDELKNVSYLLYKGEFIKSVSVNGYIKIAKGYSYIIGKIEGESIDEDRIVSQQNNRNHFKRILIISLIGYLEGKIFRKGVKELPLMGNEAFLLTNNEFELIHNFASEGEITFSPGYLLSDTNHPITLSVYKLFTSHIGIFGNTGSGKSYTLANIYHRLFSSVDFGESNSHFLLFDFNGEYSSIKTITKDKVSYILSTNRRADSKNGEKEYPCSRIPLPKNSILDVDLMSIISNATEKTQKPFLKRTLSFYKKVLKADDPIVYYKSTLRKLIKLTFEMGDKQKAETIVSYIVAILISDLPENVKCVLDSDFQWHNRFSCFAYSPNGTIIDYFDSKKPDLVSKLNIYKAVEYLKFHECDALLDIVNFLYLQLAYDVYYNRVVNEHVAPVINKLKASHDSFNKLFEIGDYGERYIDALFHGEHLCVIDMNSVNVTMKKMLPLLLISMIYNEHKLHSGSYLNIVIDEAHNILSESSDRESETWKDYRLETFEEVIKEGRKFGVFLTIASQRPSDISPTIISQLHNFFIHRLVNEMDLKMMSRSISYLDSVSHEMLPILPTGACVLAGTITEMPVVLQVSALPSAVAPQSQTIDLRGLWRKRRSE